MQSNTKRLWLFSIAFCFFLSSNATLLETVDANLKSTNQTINKKTNDLKTLIAQIKTQYFPGDRGAALKKRMNKIEKEIKTLKKLFPIGGNRTLNNLHIMSHDIEKIEGMIGTIEEQTEKLKTGNKGAAKAVTKAVDKFKKSLATIKSEVPSTSNINRVMNDIDKLEVSSDLQNLVKNYGKKKQ